MTSIRKWAMGLMVLAAVVLLTGCSGEKDRGKVTSGKDKVAGEKEKGKEEHPSVGPHGGAIAEWGDEEYHAELTVDHKAKTATVYILGPDVKKAVPIKAEKVLLSIKKPALQVELKPQKQKDDPEGTASAFVGTHDSFANEQGLEGTISAEFAGKQYAGDFKEGHEHPHKKK